MNRHVFGVEVGRWGLIGVRLWGFWDGLMILTALMTWEGHLYFVLLRHWALIPACYLSFYKLWITETGVGVHLEFFVLGFCIWLTLFFFFSTLPSQLGIRETGLYMVASL